jgi:hypothetical protein
MKRILIVLGLVFAASNAIACDTYTSVKKAPGIRVLVRDSYSGDLTIRDGKKERHFTISSAGTGSGIVVAIPDDGKTDPAQIDLKNGTFWVGPEKFVEYCK